MRRPILRRPWFWLLVLFVALIGAAVWNHRFGVPEDFDHMEAQYKYGSIGADHPLAQAPLPYWMWKVLPDLFPPGQVVPRQMGPRNGRPGFAAFGLVSETAPERPHGWVAGEPAFERPIGFSRRRVFGMDFVGLNCAFCHLGTLRPTADAPQFVVLGGTGQGVDIEQYFLFLFSALTAPDFTADKVMPAIDRELVRQNAELGWVQRAIYRYLVIPLLPSYLRHMEKDKFDFISANNPGRFPQFGPGRVDTWGLYKRVFVDPPAPDDISGTVDFTSLWNQKARTGMRMHWDGNTDVLVERNVVSALSIVGRRIGYLDFERLTRVTDWIEGLLPPRYEDHAPADLRGKGLPAVDATLALRGAGLFEQHCARCHAPQGDRLGRVEPIDGLGTDAERIAEFTPALAASLNRLGTDQWKLRNFRLQNGYVNNLLDGIWLRAPYLHNGSVPTLHDLLNVPAERPKRFCRGSDEYDWQKLGYVSAMATDDPTASYIQACPRSYTYDTGERGNSHGGHLYGTELSADEKTALLEFMKTL